MSSPRDAGNHGNPENDIVSRIGSMSDSDLDALLVGSAASRAGDSAGDDPFAEVAKKMAQGVPRPQAPEKSPGTPLGAITDDGALDIAFSDYEPPAPSHEEHGVFGPDREEEKIDPTQVPDHGVQESVRDRSRGIDYSALNPDGDDTYGDDVYDDLPTDDYPEIDEDGNPVIPEDTRFAPRRPTVPDADDDAAPGAPGAFGRPHPDSEDEVDYSRRWQEDQADFDDDDDDDDNAASGPGLLQKAKDKYKALPGYLQIAIPLGLVVSLILGFMMLGGEDTTSPGGTPTGGGQIAGNDPGAVPGGEDQGIDGDVLTPLIKTVSARCADGSTGASTAFNSDPSIAWVCHRVHGIDGAVLNIVFTKPVTLTEIRLVPGYDYVRQPSGDDEWNRHRVVTNILWRAGGKQFPQEIVASRGQAVYTFDEPVVTESMSLTIQRSVSPAETAGEGPEGQQDPFAESFGEDPAAAPSAEDVLDATAVQNIEIIGSSR